MRTLVDIDQSVLNEAMSLANLHSKKEAVNTALKEFVKTLQRRKLKAMAGSDAVDMTLDELKELRKKS